MFVTMSMNSENMCFCAYLHYIPGVPKKTIPSLISCNVKPIKAISLK